MAEGCGAPALPARVGGQGEEKHRVGERSWVWEEPAEEPRRRQH